MRSNSLAASFISWVLSESCASFSPRSASAIARAARGTIRLRSPAAGLRVHAPQCKDSKHRLAFLCSTMRRHSRAGRARVHLTAFTKALIAESSTGFLLKHTPLATSVSSGRLLRHGHVQPQVSCTSCSAGLSSLAVESTYVSTALLVIPVSVCIRVHKLWSWPPGIYTF